jgi:hypothetical protein
VSPFQDGAGHSDYTPAKQFELAAFLRVAAPILLNTSRRFLQPPLMIDVTAGPGVIQGREGSPLILLRAFAEVLDPAIPATKPIERFRTEWTGSPARFVLCDRNRDAASSLHEALNGHPAVDIVGREHIELLHENNERSLLERVHKSTGLLYWDGNPGDSVPLDALGTFVRHCPAIDLLLNVAINGAFKRKGLDPLIGIDRVRALKPHWSVRHWTTNNRQQFIFLLGSRWQGDSNKWVVKLPNWRNADANHEGDHLIRGLCHGPDQLRFTENEE